MPGNSFGTLVLLFMGLPLAAYGQTALAQSADGLPTAVRQLYESADWTGLLAAIPENSASPDLCYYRGMALARLQRWTEARKSFEAGSRTAPSDPRFPRELAGVLFRLKDYSSAKVEMRRVLRLSPGDAYALDFLGTLYLMEGNIEAALKHWNPVSKPLVARIKNEPQPRLDPVILDRALVTSPATPLQLKDYRDTRAYLDNLDIYPSYRFELKPNSAGDFDLMFHPVERNGWGSKAERIFQVVRGIPSLTVRADLFNLRQQAINWESRIRFDPQKRRAFTQYSSPLGGIPAWRYQVYLDGRRENWDLTRSFQGEAPLPGDLRLQRLSVGVEFRNRPNWLWDWRSGFEVAYRNYRNMPEVSPLSKGLFSPGVSVKYVAGVERSLLSIPERRLNLRSFATFEAGKLFRQEAQRFTKLQGGAFAEWFPQASGDDYQVTTQFRAGRQGGSLPFDELFIFGLERDNDLWLRGHIATDNRKRGSGFLGREYLLVNWEINKRIYQNSFFDFRLGPALDTGKIYDEDRSFGSKVWLWDIGVLLKVRVLNRADIILSYGKDLRTGRNAFYATSSR